MSNALKTVLILGGLVTLTAVVVGMRALWSTPAAGHAPVVNAAPISAFGVDEFMKTDDSPKGSVTINGVVSGAIPDQHLVMLVDDADGACLGSACCTPLTLPVRWSGTAPARGSAVTISGQVDKVDGKLVFVATGLVQRGKAP